MKDHIYNFIESKIDFLEAERLSIDQRGRAMSRQADETSDFKELAHLATSMTTLFFRLCVVDAEMLIIKGIIKAVK